MIYPKKNKLIRGLFRLYLLRLIRNNFNTVNFNTIEIEPDKSILLVANHFSWWDAFLMYYVFARLTGKYLHVMVTEETMRKEWIFKYIGAFSVNKHSRDVVTSLNYAAELLANPGNLVLIFPQGRLYSNFVNDVCFEPGLIKIMAGAKDKFQLVYAATFMENFQYKKPTASVYLNSTANAKFDNVEALNKNYHQHYHAALLQQTKIVL